MHTLPAMYLVVWDCWGSVRLVACGGMFGWFCTKWLLLLFWFVFFFDFFQILLDSRDFHESLNLKLIGIVVLLQFCFFLIITLSLLRGTESLYGFFHNVCFFFLFLGTFLRTLIVLIWLVFFHALQFGVFWVLVGICSGSIFKCC